MLLYREEDIPYYSLKDCISDWSNYYIPNDLIIIEFIKFTSIKSLKFSSTSYKIFFTFLCLYNLLIMYKKASYFISLD
jgi:hypothetical protein